MTKRCQGSSKKSISSNLDKMGSNSISEGIAYNLQSKLTIPLGNSIDHSWSESLILSEDENAWHKTRIQIIRNSRIFISKTFKFMPLQTHPDCLRLFIFRIAQIRISIFDPDESGKEIMRKYGNKTRLQLHSAQENKDDSMMTQNVNGSLHKETTL